MAGDGPGLKPKFVRLDWAGILLFLGVTGVTCSGGPPPYTLVLASRVCQLVPASELGPNEIVDVWDLGGPGLTARLEIALAPQVLDPKTKPECGQGRWPEILDPMEPHCSGHEEKQERTG